MMVNLKYGYGGRTIKAVINPIKEPDMVAKITLTGMNHLQKSNFVNFYPKSVTKL